ncbi:retrotransposon protein, putative, ty1-copia subclass [Tanacetum coccineum]
MSDFEFFLPSQQINIILQVVDAPVLEAVDVDGDFAETTTIDRGFLVNFSVCKTIGSKWIFKKKTDMDGIVHTYKARLVVKGYTELYMVDYEETFSHVADIRAIRILISIAAYYDLRMANKILKLTS